MSFKKLGAALLATFILGAAVASSAFATNEFKETGGQWYTGASPGTKLPEGTTKVLTTTAVGTQQLESTITTKLKISATGVNCVGCVIKNVGTAAKVEGALEYTGVSVVEPAGCSTTSTITTKALAAVLGMNTAGTVATLKFTPQSGGTVATVELTGASCKVAGLTKMTGTIFAQATNATGVFASNQEIVLTESIQKSAGEADSLKFGEFPAFVTGAVRDSIGGTEWAGKEK